MAAGATTTSFEYSSTRQSSTAAVRTIFQPTRHGRLQLFEMAASKSEEGELETVDWSLEMAFRAAPQSSSNPGLDSTRHRKLGAAYPFSFSFS